MLVKKKTESCVKAEYFNVDKEVKKSVQKGLQKKGIQCCEESIRCCTK